MENKREPNDGGINGKRDKKPCVTVSFTTPQEHDDGLAKEMSTSPYHTLSVEDSTNKKKSEKKGSMKKSQSFHKLQDSWRFPFEKAKAYQSLHDIDWKRIVGIEEAGSSSNPVYFVQFSAGNEINQKDTKSEELLLADDPNCESVVVKVSMYNDDEVFAGALANELEILAPKARLIQTHSAEGQVLIEEFEGLSLDAGEDNLKKYKDMVIQEYISGYSLGSPYLTGESILQSFTYRIEQIFEKDPKHCEQLGKIIALDCFTNGWDRIPVMWDNKGNPGNIHISRTEPSQIYAIDNCISCISHQENRKKYYNRLIDMIKEIRMVLHKPENDQISTTFCARLSQFVETFTNHKLSSKSLSIIQYSCLKKMESFQSLDIEKLVDRCFKKIYQNMDHTFDGEHKKVIIEFLDGCRMAIKLAFQDQ